jgi:hypothetical protein
MRVRIITALFDIKRDEKGDGRKIEDYLNWFSETLKLKCDMTIYTEERFVEFVNQNRSNQFETDVVVQNLEDIPFYHWRNTINEIIISEDYKLKMKDTNRIECYLPEYNLIQYSKFGWLEQAVEKNINHDYFLWMDAGCSRFFDGFNFDMEWPDKSKLDINKFTIQGNSNYVRMFETLDVNQYIWDNNCVLVGTLFGGGRGVINKLHQDINSIFQSMVESNCVNNEQFALAIFAKQNPELVNVLVHLDGTHLPLFKILK